MADRDKIKACVERLKKDAKAGGYLLNADESFVEMLAEGMVDNKERYGIESCPCRLYEGSNEDNMDIVCPCVYRDDDLAEHGACYCALYVATEEDSWEQKQVPERRPLKGQREKTRQEPAGDVKPIQLKYPVYRCSVCGYLCANNKPPRVCPICKTGSERFERFM